MNSLPKELYFSMLRIRMVEEKIVELYSEQEMRCPVHLSIGQEAVAVGVCEHLNRKDIVMSAHRAHAHYLAKGGNLKSMIAELYGKSTGCAMGKGGSMHLVDLKCGFFAAVPIVGSTVPIAVGVAWTFKLKKSSNIVTVFLGDGTTEEGVFFESLDFASLKNVPILFICENNFYSVYSPLSVRQPPNREIYKMVKGCHIKTFKTNGNFTNSVVSSFLKAKNYVKKNEKPVFLEYQTYRWYEHCGPNLDDHLKYRDKNELLYWKKNDPIKILENFLIKKKWMKNNSIQSMKKSIIKKIDLAFKYAKRSSFPKKKDLYKYLYK